jgi:hypothetical protein
MAAPYHRSPSGVEAKPAQKRLALKTFAVIDSPRVDDKGGKAMHKEMSDDELKEAMKIMAKFSGVNLGQERIDRDLPAFKGFMSDFDAIRNVKLAVEDEPVMVLRLKKGQSTKGGV